MFRSRFIYLFFLLVFKCQFKHVKQLSPLFLVQKMNWKITSIVQWNTNKDAQIHGNSALTAKYRLSTYMVHHWTNPVLHQNFTKRKTINHAASISKDSSEMSFTSLQDVMLTYLEPFNNFHVCSPIPSIQIYSLIWSMSSMFASQVMPEDTGEQHLSMFCIAYMPPP